MRSMILLLVAAIPLGCAIGTPPTRVQTQPVLPLSEATPAPYHQVSESVEVQSASISTRTPENQQRVSFSDVSYRVERDLANYLYLEALVFDHFKELSQRPDDYFDSKEYVSDYFEASSYVDKLVSHSGAKYVEEEDKVITDISMLPQPTGKAMDAYWTWVETQIRAQEERMRQEREEAQRLAQLTEIQRLRSVAAQTRAAQERQNQLSQEQIRLLEEQIRNQQWIIRNQQNLNQQFNRRR